MKRRTAIVTVLSLSLSAAGAVALRAAPAFAQSADDATLGTTVIASAPVTLPDGLPVEAQLLRVDRMTPVGRRYSQVRYRSLAPADPSGGGVDGRIFQAVRLSFALSDGSVRPFEGRLYEAPVITSTLEGPAPAVRGVQLTIAAGSIDIGLASN
jgi:hypothetical protein